MDDFLENVGSEGLTKARQRGGGGDPCQSVVLRKVMTESCD